MGTALADFEAAALGGDITSIKARLVASHNRRMWNCGALPASVKGMLWEQVRALHISYSSHRKLFGDYVGHPAVPAGDWGQHINWGLDSVQQTIRLALCGQLMGASIIARSQLERWTENLAFYHRLKRNEFESAPDFIDRVWDHMPGRHFFAKPSGRPLDMARNSLPPGEAYRVLTRCIHGEIESDVAAYCAGTLSGAVGGEVVHVYEALASSMGLFLQRLNAAIIHWGKRSGRHNTSLEYVRFLKLDPMLGPPPLRKEGLWPLNELALTGDAYSRVERDGWKYRAVLRGERPAGRLYRDEELIALVFAEYRLRCLEWARTAVAQERESVSNLDMRNLWSKETFMVTISEMASTYALWIESESGRSRAAATLASSLRSAYWLWLEDDSRAMAALRICLEQAAKLRAWRLRPGRAVSVGVSPSPGRWIEAAGWKRLRPLNTALGELVHFRPDVKWGGAVLLLADINRTAPPTVEVSPDAEDIDVYLYTARGEALLAVARICAAEIVASVRDVCGSVGAAFAEILGDPESGPFEGERAVEEYLVRLQEVRGYRLDGEEEWGRPPVEDT